MADRNHNKCVKNPRMIYYYSSSSNQLLIDNSSGRSAIYRLPTRKLLAVDRIFICGFVSLTSVVTGNRNLHHFKSIIPVGKPSASYILTPPKPVLLSRPAYIVREENGELCVAVAPATWTAGILT